MIEDGAPRPETANQTRHQGRTVQSERCRRSHHERSVRFGQLIIGSAWHVAALVPLRDQVPVTLAAELCIELLTRAHSCHDEEDVSDRAEHFSLGQVAPAMYA